MSLKYVLLASVILILSSCDEAKHILKKFENLEKSEQLEYKEVPGNSLSDHLSKNVTSHNENISGILDALKVSEQESANANLVAMGLIEDSDGPLTVSNETLELLGKNQERKVDFDDSEFLEDDNSYFTISPPGLVQSSSAIADTVEWTANSDSFVVSVASKIPVKDQGYRSTCSSFAGIGQIEGALLKKYSTLSEIDLSEQRFYYMSKPEHWSSGGDVNAGGSNAGTGFAKSNGYEFDGHTYPPSSPSDYNIPLEANCPYVKERKDNDLQTPQATECASGVAKVSSFNAWVYKWEERLNSAQEIYDFLLEKDYPVVVGTKLSANWENNDGMITLAEAGGNPGDSTHASGHAYLIVGARRISDTNFPNEGGMCFIIKNSWGVGWGVNGYSCMTLAWFNAWRYKDGFPGVVDVELDPEKYQASRDFINSRPDELIDPTGDTITENGGRNSQRKARRGTASFFTESSSYLNSSFSLTSEEMEFGTLISDSDEGLKVLYLVEEESIAIKGIQNDGKSVTHGLDLKIIDNKIFYEEEGYDSLEVGSLEEEGKVIVLCSRSYLNRCYVRYLNESNELTIGLSKEEALKQKTEGPYDWKDISVGGYGVELSSPSGLSNKVDLRLKSDGESTNPLRFLVKPLSGDILFSGKTVGNYQNFSLCNGDFKDVCRVVSTGEKFKVNFKAITGGEE